MAQQICAPSRPLLMCAFFQSGRVAMSLGQGHSESFIYSQPVLIPVNQTHRVLKVSRHPIRSDGYGWRNPLSGFAVLPAVISFDSGLLSTNTQRINEWARGQHSFIRSTFVDRVCW